MLRKLHLNTRKNFFPACMTEHWNRSSREDVESLLLEIFKNCPDDILCHVLWNYPAWAGMLDQMTHRGPFHLEPFCDFSPHQNVAAKWSINIKIYSIRESQGSNCQMLIAPPSHNFTISEGKTQVVGGDRSVVGVKTSLGIHRGQCKRLLGK